MGNSFLTESVMFYNVENLFRPDDKPQFRNQPSKSGLRNWNTYRYENKLFKIAHVFELAKEEFGAVPSIIGLAEVQGRDVLEDLVKKPNLENYGIVHYESMDERGVDVALLYDKTKVEILFSEPISYFFEIPNTSPQAFDTTRDVLYCKVKIADVICHVHVVHLPSKRERDINKPKRNYILKDLGERIQDVLVDKNEPILVMGDFNENPSADELKNLTINKDFNKILTNTSEELYNKGKFSTFYYKDGLLFDQILLSDYFFNEDSKVSLNESLVFQPEKIGSWDRKFRGRPFRTYSGTRYLGGYSDHFPVMVTLNIKG